jgi:hypothetical protein
MSVIRNGYFPKAVKWPITLLIAVTGAALAFARVFAFANVYLTSYSTGNLSNSTWGPNSGGIFADVKYYPAVSNQTAEASDNNIVWTSGQLSQMASAGFTSAGPVFHVFDGGSGNCAAPFNWTSYAEYKVGTGVTIVGKGAGCPLSSYTNEVRILYPRTGLVASTLYWGGASFRNTTSVLGLRHVSNDIYYMIGSNPAQRVNIYNGTWCFSTAGPYSC